LTKKERFIKAINREIVDFIPLMEIEFQIYKEYVGRELTVGKDYEKLSPKEREAALHQNADIMIETAEKAGHYAIRDIGGYWETSPGVPAYLWLPTMDDRLKQIEIIKEKVSNDYFILGSTSATMSIPDGNHLYEYSMKLFDAPDEVERECAAICKSGVEDSLKLIDAGADGIINASDVAFNTGTFISPELMDRFFFPFFNTWASRMKQENICSIWHTDGNVNAIIDRVLDSGVDAIQCVDPLAGMDIGKLVDEHGEQLTFIGNVDCSILHLGSEEDIIRETNRVLNVCAFKRGFVLCGCNAIFRGISAENYQHYIDTKIKFEKNVVLS